MKIVLDPYMLTSVRGVTWIAAGVDHGFTGLSPPRDFVPNYIQRLAELRMARPRVPDRPAVQSSSSVDDQSRFLGVMTVSAAILANRTRRVRRAVNDLK